MALRHYQGAVPNTSGMWKCPSCGAENLGSLTAGCAACKVGADGQHVGVPEPLRASTVQSGLATPSSLNDLIPPSAIQHDADAEAFNGWLLRQPAMSADGRQMARLAWYAGVDWARAVAERFQADPRDPQVQGAAPTAQTGAQLYLSVPDDSGDVKVLEDRTLQTILAALIFYRDNTLGYGAIPGQLSAQEVTELIGKLQPQEVVDDGPQF